MFRETVNYFKSVFDVPTAEMLALKELAKNTQSQCASTVKRRLNA